MKAIFENSLLVRAILCLCAWYHEGAIAHLFARIREAYADSRFRRLWERFCAAPGCTTANSGYARLVMALRRLVECIGTAAQNSLIYRLCLAIWRPIVRLTKDGIIGRALSFVGMRGLLLICLAMYLPLDYFIRLAANAGFLPSFIASGWDEMLMLAAACYLLWHTAMKRAPLQLRTTPIDAYLIMFIAAGFFLMCAVSPYPSIALAGYRAVVEYLF